MKTLSLEAQRTGLCRACSEAAAKDKAPVFVRLGYWSRMRGEPVEACPTGHCGGQDASRDHLRQCWLAGWVKADGRFKERAGRV